MTNFTFLGSLKVSHYPGKDGWGGGGGRNIQDKGCTQFGWTGTELGHLRFFQMEFPFLTNQIFQQVEQFYIARIFLY